MTEKAKLFYLIERSKNRPVITLQVGEQTIEAEITINQLALFISDGAAMAYRSRETVE